MGLDFHLWCNLKQLYPPSDLWPKKYCPVPGHLANTPLLHLQDWNPVPQPIVQKSHFFKIKMMCSNLFANCFPPRQSWSGVPQPLIDFHFPPSKLFPKQCSVGRARCSVEVVSYVRWIFDDPYNTKVPSSSIFDGSLPPRLKQIAFAQGSCTEIFTRGTCRILPGISSSRDHLEWTPCYHY